MFDFSGKINELKSSILSLAFLVASLVIGLTWLSIGLYSALKLWVGPTWSPFILGAIMLLPAFIYGLVKLFEPKPVKREAQGFAGQAQGDASLLQLSQIIQSMSGQSTIVATLVTIVAGVIATRFPALMGVFSQVVVAYAEDMKNRPPKPEGEGGASRRRRKASTVADE